MHRKDLNIIYYWTRKWMIWSCISKRIPSGFQGLILWSFRPGSLHSSAPTRSQGRINMALQNRNPQQKHQRTNCPLRTLPFSVEHFIFFSIHSKAQTIWSHYINPLCWVVGIGIKRFWCNGISQIMPNSSWNSIFSNLSQTSHGEDSSEISPIFLTSKLLKSST